MMVNHNPLRAGSSALRGVGEFGFCPVLAELIDSRQTTGRSGKVFEGLAGLSSFNNLVILRGLMTTLKPARTLEVGFAFGGSGLVFTASHRDLGHPPSRQHVALDPFQGTLWDDCGLLAIERAGLTEYLDFRPAFSSLELPKMLSGGERFNLVYVDGSHLVENVFVDAYYVARLLCEGGVVAFDDSTYPHVRKVVKFLRTNCRTGLEEIHLLPYRADRGTSYRYRIARLLGRVQMTAFRRIGVIEREWNAAFHPF
jgi:hypothetical protein